MFIHFVRHSLAWAKRLALVVCAAVVVPSAWAGQPALTTAPTATVVDERPALFGEPRRIARAISWIEDFGSTDTEGPADGFYAELGQMITGAGWLSAGPGYRRHLFHGNARIDLSAAISTRAYKIAQGRIEFPRLANERVLVGAQGFWRDFTQIRYFGAGRDSLKANETDYRLQVSDVVSYVTWKPRAAVSLSAEAGALSRVSLSSSTGPFDRNMPDTLQVFTAEPGAALPRQPRYLRGELSMTVDTRDNAGYAMRGGLYRVSWSTFRNRPSGNLTFDRYEAEAAQFVPLLDERLVIAARAFAVLTHTVGDTAVPFYLLPSLGGHNTLRGYANYRFHDRHLLVANLESRLALFPHLDAALFVDAGNVAARLLDLDLARTSYGFGLRLHTERTTLGRLDIAHSREGWRFLFKFNDALRLARLARRTAPIPFAP